jgi:hypothetical protein
LEQKESSVLKIGSPDSVWCTRTVQMLTNHSREFQGALHYNSPDCPVCHRTVRCATGLSGVPAEQQLSAPTVDSAQMNSMLQCRAEVRAAKLEGIGLSGVAPDCPMPQENKASNGRPAPNPNGWVTWWRTGQGTVPIRWRTRLSGAPIASSLPNGYGSSWGL